MYASVQSYFPAFSEKFEGRVPHMYLDITGLVTIGVGNLIDPVERATCLPFSFKDQPGAAASAEQIAAEWRRLKADTDLAKKGARACAAVTELVLVDAAIDGLIAERLAEDASCLKRTPRFWKFESWPADAQLALLSMAWAIGPGGFARFPKFSAACAALDFDTASKECALRSAGNAGIVPRNTANRVLLQNAVIVRAAEPDPGPLHATLFYPRVLTSAEDLSELARVS